MYIKVRFGDGRRGDGTARSSDVPSEVFINPDCPIRVICTLLREVFRLDEKYELDLCDSEGNLVFLYEKEPFTSGLKYFKLKATYYVVLICKENEGYSVKSVDQVNSFPLGPVGKEEVLWSDIMVRIKKQLKVNKTSRVPKLRSGLNYK